MQYLRSAVEADAAARASLIVVDVLALQYCVDREAVQSQLHAAGGVGPWVVQLNTPTFFRVRYEPIVVIFSTCRAPSCE